jgi:class 3 adenylate cyclase
MLAGHLDRLDEVSVNTSNEDSNSQSISKSNIDSSLSDSNATGATPKDSAEAEIIASKVSKQVFWLKMTVLFVLVFAAVLVATAVYLSTQRSEENAFESAFYDDVVKVYDTFKFTVERKLGAIDSLSIAITSLAVDSQASWPNFTVPDFEFRAANIRELADAASIAISPIVSEDDRAGWEAYSIENTQWIDDAAAFLVGRRLETPELDNGVSKKVFAFKDGVERVVDESPAPFLPMWQNYPAVPGLVNFNLRSNSNFHDGIEVLLETGDAVFGRIWDIESSTDTALTEFFDVWELDGEFHRDDPASKLFYPIYDGLSEGHNLVAVITAVVNWETYFQNILPPHTTGVIVVLENTCDQVYTYSIDGEEAHLIGKGDLHDKKYDYLEQSAAFADFINPDDRRVERFAQVDVNRDFCPYTLHIYPSQDLEDDFVTNNAVIYTVCVAIIFAFTGLIFLAYDYTVESRQKRVMKRAVQSRAIVSSLFPAAVRDRLFRNDDSTGSKGKNNKQATKSRIKSFLNESNQEQKPAAELRPIADLFPHTTVMFADIAGFTRWSSERDPAHVFTLLQTVYHAFDRIAKKRGVFKVETIGDCYVAVTGLPDPQADHAVRMAKFANECMKKMKDLVTMLKESLGEDTAELCMRFGLHSGPVTAGVLRGEKSRFQLFGNTVNTAARMEHSGKRNRIQVSQETADLITEAGKGHWIFQRIDDVASRGGIQTYWVEPQSNAQEAKLKNAAPTRVAAKPGAPADNSQRLIDWNVDILKRLLKRIVARRKDENTKSDPNANFSVSTEEGVTVRDEICPTIKLPKYDKNKAKTDPQTIHLGDKVENQLREYVRLLESMYHDNSFHSFKHASNVCTSANKMLNSIVDEDLYQRVSDPLTQFAVVFSALIHDLDHQGLTNMLLIKEKPHIAALYRNKSVAEQHSVDLAWNLLMDPEFEALQDTIFANNTEFMRFRKLVVNVVMATDIFDKELNGERQTRWLQAFDPESRTNPLSKEGESELKATVVIEHVMQIADIMHTMQHFHSYQRWNERLFEEMYVAFECGKSMKDPSADWYEGEIWFFDNCVIPLAQRIKDVKIFGIMGDDCLRNAISNKKEWAVKGSEIVQQQVGKIIKKAEEAAEGAENDEEKKQEQKQQDTEKEKKQDPDKHLIEWNVDLFKRMLRQILAHRLAEGIETKESMLSMATTIKDGSTVRDELLKIIDFPLFDKQASKLKVDPDTIELSKAVQDQLRDYVSFIASMYRDNPFHNFKHASNVSMAANKYMQRIVDDTLAQQMSQPLAQFAVIFAALIHDVDHTGVSNAQLVKEQKRIAVVYNNKSVAEQNSTDLALSVLMDAEYKDLQVAIYGNDTEFERFRHLVINAVMATDLFDEELIADRNQRWLEAFSEENRDTSMSDKELENLRATVLMEKIMQASDIGHTMQHFHSYKRWNERLYCEVYDGYEAGRLEADPSKDWYEGEIKFFDQFVIPLAKKLKDCGKFGNAGEDAFSAAQSNRKEWVVKGVSIVGEFKKKYAEQKEREKKNP